MLRFTTPDLSDRRIEYASEYLQRRGYEAVKKSENADFVLLGVNPDCRLLQTSLPVFAGNVSKNNVFDYTKKESFALKNAYLTAEGAVSLAISESERSLINAEVLIIGYGRIGKALHRYLNVFTNRITVCARNDEQRTLARSLCADIIQFDDLKTNHTNQFIFNTVPHPVLNEEELRAVRQSALILDLASFPGGADRHFAAAKGIRLLTARGLPAKFAPQDAGEAVGAAVEEMIKEVII